MTIQNSKFWMVCGLALVITACGGRLPSTSKSTHLIRRHFNKYSKKYEASPLGRKKVTNVEILSVDEIHKHLVSVQAFITLKSSEVHKIRVTLEKGPFGWRTLAWESLSGS